MNQPFTRRFLPSSVKASSLIEVSVAAVLLSLVLGFSFMLYGQLMRSGPSLLRLRQELHLAAYARQIKEDHAFVNEKVVTKEGWKVEKNVSLYNGNAQLLFLELKLYDQQSTHETTPALIYREIIYTR